MGTLQKRDKLARELIELRRRYAPYEARDAEICSLLKAEARDGGNFEVVINKVGRIKVSSPREKAMKGLAPEIIVDAFLGLPQMKRDRLIEDGIVKMEPQYSGAYYGAVTVELY